MNFEIADPGRNLLKKFQIWIQSKSLIQNQKGGLLYKKQNDLHNILDHKKQKH